VEKLLKDVHHDTLAGRIAAERVDRRLAESHRAVMESLLARAEEAWERSDAEGVWRNLEGPLDEAQRYWRGLVGGGVTSILLDGHFTLEEAVVAYEAALTLAAARVQVLLLIGEKRAALHHAYEFHGWHDEAMGRLVAIDIAAARSRQLASAMGLSEEDARSQLLRKAKHFTKRVHEAQLHIATRPELLRTLIDRDVNGREYVEAVREGRHRSFGRATSCLMR